MSGENTEDNATARAIADLQELMRLMREEIKVMKMSGVTRAGNDPLQQLGVSDNAMNPVPLAIAQAKRRGNTVARLITMMRTRKKGKIEKRTMMTLQKMKARHCFRCLKQETPS